MGKHHLLLVCMHPQSHINPLLRLGRKLTSLGARVTLSTVDHAHRRMFPDHGGSLPLADPLDPLFFYHPYSDGFDSGRPEIASGAEFIEKAATVGSETLYAVAAAPDTPDRPAVTCIIYTIIVPWVANVARRIGIPSFFFWIQPAALFAVYYHYFHDYGAAIDDILSRETDSDEKDEGCEDCSSVVELPGLPRLHSGDIPTLIMGKTSRGEVSGANSNPGLTVEWTNALLCSLEQSFQVLDEERTKPPKVFVNTFNALEVEVIQSLSNSMELIPIGPMLPPDQSVVGEDYMEWLGRWPDRSVIYISFGTISQVGRDQLHEFAKGLTGIGRPFFWILRGGDDVAEVKESVLQDAAGKGRTADWCDQVKVLQHPSVGCFVTHCGWNSVSEAIAAGVPMVAMPFWSDQPTNARLITDTWQVGVRVKADGEGIVKSGELQRCIDQVMGGGEQGTAIRGAATEWKDKATEAIQVGGLTDRNLKSFLEG